MTIDIGSFLLDMPNEPYYIKSFKGGRVQVLELVSPYTLATYDIPLTFEGGEAFFQLNGCYFFLKDCEYIHVMEVDGHGKEQTRQKQ